MNTRIATLALCLLLPLTAQAGEDRATGISAEIRQDLQDARRETSAELAKARLELISGNLRIDNSLQFGDHRQANRDLPPAEITPQGDLLIDGKPQAIDAGQRKLLLAYRGQVVKIAMAGIDIGERAAEAALDAVDHSSWIGLLFNSLSGRMERRVERIVRGEVEPAVHDICRQLPSLKATQDLLASSLPPFRPYADLEADDIEDCENEVRHEFASL